MLTRNEYLSQHLELIEPLEFERANAMQIILQMSFKFKYFIGGTS